MVFSRNLPDSYIGMSAVLDLKTITNFHLAMENNCLFALLFIIPYTCAFSVLPYSLCTCLLCYSLFLIHVFAEYT